MRSIGDDVLYYEGETVRLEEPNLNSDLKALSDGNLRVFLV
ncbi:MAG: hypothetical protein ACI4HQ_03555 [Acetatifactor sp.]